jgi:hypothetical protein
VSAEARAPQDHPLRPVRRIVDDSLRRLSPRFERLYVRWGQPSIAPEKLLRALLPQILYTIRSGGSSSSSSRYNLQGPVRVSVVVLDGDRPRQRTARSQVTPKRVVKAVSNLHISQVALCISAAGAGDPI